MAQVFLSASTWIPGVFNWVIAPIAILLLGLSAIARTRTISTHGLTITAALSITLMSVLLASAVFLLFGYARALASVLLNFGPAIARGFVADVLAASGSRLAVFIPAIATTIGSSVAAAMLRGRRSRLPAEPGSSSQP